MKTIAKSVILSASPCRYARLFASLTVVLAFSHLTHADESIVWDLLTDGRIESIRVWQNREGKSIEAKIIAWDTVQDLVQLMRNGKVLKVPLADLSDSDQEYVRQYAPRSGVLTMRAKTRSWGRSRKKTVSPYWGQDVIEYLTYKDIEVTLASLNRKETVTVEVFFIVKNKVLDRYRVSEVYSKDHRLSPDTPLVESVANAKYTSSTKVYGLGDTPIRKIDSHEKVMGWVVVFSDPLGRPLKMVPSMSHFVPMVSDLIKNNRHKA